MMITYRFSHFCRALDNLHSNSLERFNFVGCLALSSGDNGAGVAHSAAWRCRESRNEGHHGFLCPALLDEGGRFLLQSSPCISQGS